MKKTNEDDVASLELSILAKDKGFDWMETDDDYSYNKLYAWNHFSNKYILVDINYLTTSGNSVQYSYHENKPYMAPTLSLLQKWLRDVHDIILIINPITDKRTNVEGELKFYADCITNKFDPDTIFDTDANNLILFSKYEETLSDALTKILNAI